MNSGSGCSRIGMIGGPPGMSGAVMTACTPGIFSAAEASIETEAAVRDRAAQDHGVEQARHGDVVDIFAAAAQEAQVLAPLHRRCR